MPAITHITHGEAATEHPYSTLCVAGGFVFVSGQIADVSGTDTPDLSRQVVEVIGKVAAALAGVGAALGDVVRTNCYITDAADFDVLNRVYAAHFPVPAPARTTVVVSLAGDGLLFEMDCIALLPAPDTHGS